MEEEGRGTTILQSFSKEASQLWPETQRLESHDLRENGGSNVSKRLVWTLKNVQYMREERLALRGREGIQVVN